MALYFLDSSAIVKRYFQEQGHEWIEILHDPAKGHGLYIAQVALVEVVASICRKAREQNIPVEERDKTIDDFRQDVQKIYSIWLVESSLYTVAGDLCRSHQLRAYDAIQLACALAIRKDILAAQSPEARHLEIRMLKRLLNSKRTPPLHGTRSKSSVRSRFTVGFTKWSPYLQMSVLKLRRLTLFLFPQILDCLLSPLQRDSALWTRTTILEHPEAISNKPKWSAINDRI